MGVPSLTVGRDKLCDRREDVNCHALAHLFVGFSGKY